MLASWGEAGQEPAEVKRTKKPDNHGVKARGIWAGVKGAKGFLRGFRETLSLPPSLSPSPCVWLGIVHDFKSHRKGDKYLEQENS